MSKIERVSKTENSVPYYLSDAYDRFVPKPDPKPTQVLYRALYKAYSSNVYLPPGVDPTLARARTTWKGDLTDIDSTRKAQTSNLTRSKVISRIHGLDKAEWLTSAGEWRKSLAMVQKRTNQLNNAAGYFEYPTWKRMQLAAKALQVATPFTRKRYKSLLRARGAGSLWLEYWMGWAPLIGDIQLGFYNLANHQPVPKIVSAISKSRDQRSNHLEYNGGQWVRNSGWFEYSSCLRCAVTSINPNKSLARSLGVTNPWLTIHNLIPWTWFIGWFSNLAEMLGQWDDLYGVDIEPRSIASTVLREAKNDTELYVGSPLYRKRSHYLFKLNRDPLTSLPIVKGWFALPDRLSPTRAATSISLLVTLFVKLPSIKQERKPRRFGTAWWNYAQSN